MITSLFAQWFAVLYVGAVSFGLTALLARVLGPESFGVYSTALAGGALAGILIDGGMRTLILREHSRASEHLQGYSARLLSFGVGHAVIATVGLVLLCALMFPLSKWLLFWATLFCFFGVVLVQLVSAALRGDGKIIADAKFLVAVRTLSAIAIAAVVFAGFDAPWTVLAVWAVVSIAVASSVLSTRRVGFWERIPKEVYQAVLPFFVLDLAITIYIRSDMLVLSAFGINESLIGQYAAAFRICEAYIMLSGPLGLLFFRHLRVMGKSFDELRGDILLALLQAFVVGGVIVACVFFFSPLIIKVGYGDRYVGAAGFLRWLSLMLLFVLPNMIFTQAALALGRERLSMYVALCVAFISVIANIFLVPVYGVMAAVWTTVVTEALIFVMMFGLLFFSRRPAFRPS